MNGKQLRNSILQGAISGRLVPQDPTDEPAIALLRRINPKAAPLSPDDAPFPVPDSWCWCKVGDIAFVTKLAGFEYTDYIAGNLEASGVPLFKGKNVKEGEIIYEFESFIPEWLSDELERSQIRKKCLITPYVGTIGNIGLHNKQGKFHLGSNVGKIEILNPDGFTCIHEEYVHYYLRSTCGYAELTKFKKATAQESISIQAIREVFIPIPPTKEQERIVRKVEELLPLVERYDKAQTALDRLNASLKGKLRASVLQEAIAGRLVPQDPNDEPAIELLKRINPKATPITEEVPFPIPDSWCWVRGKQIFLPMESTKPQGDFKYVDVEAVNNKTNQIEKPKSLSQAYAPSRATRKLHNNDVLFSMVRPYLRNIALVTEEYKDAIASTGFYVLTPSKAVFPKYLFYLVLSNYIVDGLNAFMKGDNSPSINNKHIEEYIFPLPPLAEQERIVGKVEELFAVLDALH